MEVSSVCQVKVLPHLCAETEESHKKLHLESQSLVRDLNQKSRQGNCGRCVETLERQTLAEGGRMAKCRSMFP